MHDDDIAALAEAASRDADANDQRPLQQSQQDCGELLRAVLPGTVEAAPKKKATPGAGAMPGRH